MSKIINHTELNARLASHACQCRLGEHNAIQSHREAVEHRATIETTHLNAPKSRLDALLAEADRHIAGHEKRGRVMARRAEHAEQGFLVSSPDEDMDADLQREHGDFYSAMHAAGRVRRVEEGA
jgi:hypothetical protein